MKAALARFMTPVEWSLLALFTFVLLVGAVRLTEEVLLVGECGVGPAAPSSCTWDEAEAFDEARS